MPRTSGENPEQFEVLCLGETMVLLTPTSGRSLEQRPHLEMVPGGAESNVACVLAQLGHRVSWLSRVGDDPFGRVIADTVTSYGVDTRGVEVDKARHTGVFFKDPAPGGSTVYYYRQRSAATEMGPEFFERTSPNPTQFVHLSGITPALSQSCAALIERLLMRRSVAGPKVSFDINFRPALWSRDTAAKVLLPLARAADVVFVGRDEAEELWGTTTDDEVRALLPDVDCLVVKDAGNAASCYEGTQCTHVTALPMEVVEPVGAGDAFAAGFLSGMLTERPARDRLRLGHVTAALTLRSTSDIATLPEVEVLERACTANDADWPYSVLAALSS